MNKGAKIKFEIKRGKELLLSSTHPTRSIYSIKS
jgi:hypothetical protein